MFHYLSTLPICGCYTFSLLLIVTFLLWKVMSRVHSIEVKKVVAPIQEIKPKRKKCSKKGPCKKDKNKLKQTVFAYFTCSDSQTRAEEFRDFFLERRVESCLKDLRTAFDNDGNFLAENTGSSFFFVREKSEKLEQWLLREVTGGKKPLSNFVFAVFSDGPSETAAEYDKLLWKAGARRLKKFNGGEEYPVWQEDIFKLVTGKSSSSCGCGDGSSSSSCDSDEDGEGDKNLIVDVEDLLLN